METIGEMRKLNPKSKMAESQFALSHKIVVDQLKLNSKNKNTTKSNECLGKKGQMKENSTLNWEEYERKDLNKKLQMFCAEVCTKDGFFYNFVENNYYKQKIVLLLVHFVICGHS